MLGGNQVVERVTHLRLVGDGIARAKAGHRDDANESRADGARAGDELGHAVSPWRKGDASPLAHGTIFLLRQYFGLLPMV
jgi:hypothetical protein